MNIDPKKLAEEASAKVSGLGGNFMDQAKDKIGDVIDQVKEKAGGNVADSLKEKAAEALGKGADLLDGLADKLKH
ncbi:MAG: hypothetical protein K2F87_02365 [Muribaculaceae bacterium]|nr:hypothetical protein [Muribaculaceae bacterium]